MHGVLSVQGAELHEHIQQRLGRVRREEERLEGGQKRRNFLVILRMGVGKMKIRSKMNHRLFTTEPGSIKVHVIAKSEWNILGFLSNPAPPFPPRHPHKS